ncbi:hypothetical protein AgCh_017536 [Apium graveolens]
MVRLKNGTSGHGGVVNCKCFFSVVYGLDLVVSGWSEEEEIVGGAVKHFAVARHCESETTGSGEWSSSSVRREKVDMKNNDIN